jgi:putative sporulation protein YyaC
MNNPLAVLELAEKLEHHLTRTGKKKAPIICCIGTDRATGDSLGPLTGWRLQTLLQGFNIEIFGTIENPVHATNLPETLAMLTPKMNEHPLIAVDACLGPYANIGTIVFHPGPLKPGTAVKKQLPEVGDIGITGIVNVGGFMELQILQNTRLNTVLKMSQVIANSIYLALRNVLGVVSFFVLSSFIF